MTNMYEIGVPIESALAHFAGLGLASIARDVYGETCMLRWSDTDEPRMQVMCRTRSESDFPNALSEISKRLCAPGEWVSSTTDLGGKEPAGTFSPRVKIVDDEAWARLQSQRHHYLDSLTSGLHWVDLDLIAALGEPAYWRIPNTNQGPQPDQGASRWEMKERNKGQEFMQHRFSRLVHVVSALDIAEIDEALRCLTPPNEVVSATGFAKNAFHPALVYAALWGISCFPVTRFSSRQSATACAFPLGVLHSRLMVIPVSTEFRTLAWWKGMIACAALDCVGTHLQEGERANRDDDQLALAAALSWLSDHGVTAVVRFPIKKAGSDAAPQRIVLDGEIFSLEDIDVK